MTPDQETLAQLANAARPRVQAILTEAEKVAARFQEQLQMTTVVRAFAAGYAYRQEEERQADLAKPDLAGVRGEFEALLAEIGPDAMSDRLQAAAEADR